MTPPLDYSTAQALDAADALRAKRSQFLLPKDVIYLDGNSLGPLPAMTPQHIDTLVRNEWGRDLIGSWNRHDWIGLPQRLGARIAQLIGAKPLEVVVADSTSVNLFKLLVAACTARPERGTILTEPGNFPTDLYIAQGVAELLPQHRVETVEADRIATAIDENTAVVLLTHVHYKTGRMLDMARITAAAHARGALTVWDLSHSAGAVPLDLNACNADLAVGCGYKYLSGGPGAPSYLFVAERLQAQLRSPLTGWMGHGAPFAFIDNYFPATGVSRFLCGTPSILAMGALAQGVAIFDDVDFTAYVAKSRALGDYFIASVESTCAGHDLTLISPRDATERGSHVSFSHPEAYALCQALIARGVITDFRAPDAIRFGFMPLYTSYEDIYRSVEILARVLADRFWDQAQFRVRAKVT